jgi:O-methyltransferase
MMIKEFLLRATNFPFLLSRTRSFALGSWRSISHDEFSKIYRTVRPYTMCCNTRLYALYKAIKSLENQNLPGDIVECGTAQGGSAALMGLTLKSINANRTMWVFDSFEGIPAPSDNDPDQDIAKNYIGSFRGDYTAVESLFSKLNILPKTRLVKGLFQDSLSTAEIKNIALLHIDGDWYDSIMVCLECLYDNVSVGGIIQFDDYGYWKGARKAVHDFMNRYDLNDQLIVIDYEGRQWVKSKNRSLKGSD